MPVSEFGMALLRGMGKKRRANGEVIVIKNPNLPPDEEERKREKEAKKLRDPNMGFLGIGAKGVKIGGGGGSGKGAAEDGLGAWGKADMRRSKHGKGGEGLYTPVMLRDRRTGELISERELEERKKAAKEAADKKNGNAGSGRSGSREEDWRERRDRNLGRDARRRDRGEDDPDQSLREKLNGSSSNKMIEYPTAEDASRNHHSSSTSNPDSSRRSTRSRDRLSDRDDRDRERVSERRRVHTRNDDDDDATRYDSSTSSSIRRNGNGNGNGHRNGHRESKRYEEERQVRIGGGRDSGGNKS